MAVERGPEGPEWHYLGVGELIVRIDEHSIQEVTAVLGADWEWDSVEFGVITDEALEEGEDGTVTEWATLMGVRRRSLTATPDLEVVAAA